MERVKRVFPFLVSGLLVVTVFVIQFVVLSMNEKFKINEFLTQLGINTLLLVVMAVTWLNAGVDRAKNEEKSAYKANLTIYAEKANGVTERGRLRQLREFCEQKTEQQRTKKETALLLRVGIDREAYEELKSLTVEELRKKGYARKQIRAIRKVREGLVKVREINAIELMTNSKVREEYDVHYDEKGDMTARTAIRAIKAIVTASVLSLLVPSLSENIGSITVWALFLMKLFTMVYTGWSAEREGYLKITEDEKKVIRRRIALLDEFEEWAAVPRLPAPGNK